MQTQFAFIGLILGSLPSLMSEKNNFYAAAIREKNTLTALLRQKNYDNVAAAADIYTGAARFQTDHTVEVQLTEKYLYTAKKFL